MIFEKVASQKSSYFQDIWSEYESTFPPDERRDLDAQLALFQSRHYSLFAILENNVRIGFLSAWKFDGFDFIEHFALREEKRGQGLGTKVIESYLKEAKKVILEVEKPETETQKRRIQFYEKLGFKLNPHDYVQPPYSKDKKPLHLFLMSFPEKLSETDFKKIRIALYKIVYGLQNWDGFL